jgi:photosystem II stability/assembly factor-like uncharacterized protein
MITDQQAGPETGAAPAIRAPRTVSRVWLRIGCGIAVAVGAVLIGVFACLAWLVVRAARDAYPASAYDCLASAEDGSLIVFLETTGTAYRSRDGGMTWSREATIEDRVGMRCSWSFPVVLESTPPVGFYVMQGLGLYQSLDGGETLTFIPLELQAGQMVTQGVATRFDTVVISVGGGELWLRMPDGEWIRYSQRSDELLPERAPE